MVIKTGNRLTNWQTWQLTTTVFVIYWPIRLYVALDSFSLLLLQRLWALWLMEIVVTILFLALWLTIIDWILQRFFSLQNKDFLIEFSLSSQMATFIVAGVLAVLFNMAFSRLWLAVSAEFSMNFSQHAHSQPSLATLQAHNRREKSFDGLTIMAMLSVFYLAANRRGYNHLEADQVEAQQLKREVTQTQFTALRSQVNPHFLFNSLGTLSSLIEVNPKLSIQFISQLAKAYRFVVEQHDSDRIKLQAELSFLKTYMFLLNIRLQNQLVVVTEITPEKVNQYSIVPLTLQLLIENVVKHNQLSSEEPLRVTIQTEGNYLLIANSIRPRSQVDEATHPGLKNIKDHYRLLTDRPVWFGEEYGLFVVKSPLLL